MKENKIDVFEEALVALYTAKRSLIYAQSDDIHGDIKELHRAIKNLRERYEVANA